MKMAQYLVDKLVIPLVVRVLSSIISISIGSKIITGDWIEWFYLIPKRVWIIFGMIIFLWVIITVIHERNKQGMVLEDLWAVSVTPEYEWITIGKLDYAGVVWRVRTPAPASWEYFNPSTSSIKVETPPLCPKCETELEESRSFWRGYVWRCVGCGFQKRNRDSYYREAERAEKLARREWEKQEHERIPRVSREYP